MPTKKASSKKSAGKKTMKGVKAAKATKAMPPKGGFMWKLLQEKQAEQKMLAERHQKNPMFTMGGNSTQSTVVKGGFGRFAGPRRRAA